jgi:hypothetical protein
MILRIISPWLLSPPHPQLKKRRKENGRDPPAARLAEEGKADYYLFPKK